MDEIEKLIDELEPEVRKLVEEAFATIRSDVTLAEIEELLLAGDIDGAVMAIRAEPALFNSVADEIAMVYRAGAAAAVAAIPRTQSPTGRRVRFIFDVRDPTTENRLRQRSSEFVTRISESVRETIREQMAEGMARGKNPKSTALEIVGRKSRQTGRRTGGVIGLTPSQAKFVQNAREELLSGDPELMRNYLRRSRRDERMDPKVLRAIKEGKPLSAEDAERAVAQYSDSLLLLRGEMIARTETIGAIHAGQEEAMRQAVDSGALRPEWIEKIWKTARDTRVRDSHMALHGRVVQYDMPFVSNVTGSRLMHPHDRSLGAEPSEIINCRCHAFYRVNFAAQMRARRRMVG